jgi:hypothetical protein
VAFEQLLHSGQVGGHGGGVAVEFGVADTGLTAQGEDQLATLAIGDHPHRIEENLPAGQDDPVVGNPVAIWLGHLDHHLPEWRLGDPASLDELDRAGQAGGPLCQVRRLRDVVIDLRRRPVDSDAQVHELRCHGLIVAERSEAGTLSAARLIR